MIIDRKINICPILYEIQSYNNSPKVPFYNKDTIMFLLKTRLIAGNDLS
jgi:hypothetical protein